MSNPALRPHPGCPGVFIEDGLRAHHQPAQHYSCLVGKSIKAIELLRFRGSEFTAEIRLVFDEGPVVSATVHAGEDDDMPGHLDIVTR